ncbi:hypothetical protein D3C71_1889850 [compost metagenome]
MRLHRCAGGDFNRLRIAFALGLGLLDRPADRQITVARIMRRGLVGNDIGAWATGLHALDQFREDFGGIAEQADRFGFALGRPLGD